MKKNYVIVGDNNFWYATPHQVTEKELEQAIKDVKKGIKNGEFTEAVDLAEPTELRVFETKDRKVVTL